MEKTGIVGMIIITAILAGVFNYEANAIEVTNLDELPDIMSVGGGSTNWELYARLDGKFTDETGTLEENTEVELRFETTLSNIIKVTFILTWVDEGDYSSRHQNQPDTFSLSVVQPDGLQTDSIQENDGNINLELEFVPQNDPYNNGTGEYVVTIQCHDCGDHELWRPSTGILEQPDTGNDWALSGNFEYYEKTD